MDIYKEDLHIHTNFSPCGHPSATLENIIAESVKKGMKKIAITEHYYSPESNEGDGWVYTTPQKILNHLKELKEKQAELKPPFVILIGIEADVRKNGIDYIPEEILDSCEIVMACLHHIPGTKIRWNHRYGEEEHGIVKQVVKENGKAKLIEDTLKLYLKISKNRRINQIGHPFKELAMSTLTNKENLIPEDLLISFYDNLKENNISLELNPSIWGIATPESKFFIRNYIDYLKLAKERGVNFYFGSDSHRPDTIGQNSRKEIDELLIGRK